MSTKSSLFVYPSRRLGISLTHEVRRISSRAVALVSHHAPACIYLRLDDIQRQAVDDIPQQVADDIHAFGVIGTRDCGKLLNYLAKYDIIFSKGVIVWLKTIY